jgi:hypothetical protein
LIAYVYYSRKTKKHNMEMAHQSEGESSRKNKKVRGNQMRGEPYVYLLLSWVIDSSVEGDAAATAGQT